MYLKPRRDLVRHRTRERTREVRRRRVGALAVLVAVIAVVAVVVAASSGGGGAHGVASGTRGLGAAATPTVITQGPAPGPQTSGPAFTPAPAAVATAARLPLAAQVAQVFLIGVDGTDTNASAIAAFGSENWGGAVLSRANFISDGQIGSLAAGLATLARNAGNVAPLVAAPQEGGPDTAFPNLPPAGEAAIGATGKPAVARSQAELAGKQLLALHVNMTLAPLADVDVLNGAMSGRLFSTSAHSVGEFASAAIAGYAAAGIISAAGHFPGAGAASQDPDQMSASVGGSLAQLEGDDLRPFATIAPSAPVIMMSNAAYSAFDGVTPAGLLPAAVHLLRDRYRFPGVIMTDDLDAALESTGGTAGQAAVSALQAGDDLLYITGSPAEQLSAYHAVLTAAQSGQLSRARLRDALLRVLTLKARQGLL